jgi:CHAD domain-containing protein
MAHSSLPPDVSFGDAARLQLREHTGSVLANLPGTIRGEVVALHDIRVASRRLRAALAVYAPSLDPALAEPLTRAARRLTRALGPVRDLDVQLEALAQAEQSPGVKRLIRVLQKTRRGERRKLLSALRRWDAATFEGVLTHALAQPLPNTPLSQHQEAIGLCKAKVLALSDVIHDPSKVEELHELRIAVKHLRYTVEIFAVVLPEEKRACRKPLAALQEHLGQIHDLDVLVPLVAQAQHREKQRKKKDTGLEALQTQQIETRQRLYAEFIALWDTHQAALAQL